MVPPMDEKIREASCSCGQLRIRCTGEPVRVSVCHCLACQKRTGSAFGVQARFPTAKTQTFGAANTWVRVGDEGNRITHYFCPTCGSTVYYHLEPELMGVPVGAFADPSFPPPRIEVYESRRHPWVGLPSGIEHYG